MYGSLQMFSSSAFFYLTVWSSLPDLSLCFACSSCKGSAHLCNPLIQMQQQQQASLQAMLALITVLPIPFPFLLRQPATHSQRDSAHSPALAWVCLKLSLSRPSHTDLAQVTMPHSVQVRFRSWRLAPQQHCNSQMVQCASLSAGISSLAACHVTHWRRRQAVA